MNAKFPRLLFVSEFPPNAPGGGPALVRQTLKDWPVENLFWWSCFPESDARFGQKTAEYRSAVIPRKLYPKRWLRAPRAWLMEHIWSPWATGHLRETLRLFKPDVVWVVPHAWSIPPLQAVLPAAGIPFHVSAQDYPDIRANILQFGAARCRRLAARLDDLYAKATSRDAICRPMVADLQARTGCAGDVWHAGVEPEERDYVAGKTETPGDKIRIAYAGTIIVEEAFEFVVAALARIRERLPRPLTLELFGGHSCRARRWFDPSWMIEHGILPEAQFTSGLRKCTWGLTAMSLTDDDPRYNRFSFPTKTVTYLGAGLPILAIGHPQSSLIQITGAYKIGLCSSASREDELQRQLLEVLAEPQPFLKYKSEILRCISAEFEMLRLRKAMYDYFFTGARTGEKGRPV